VTTTRRSSLLAQAPSDDLIHLADTILGELAHTVSVVRPPEVGLRMFQVREPIERIRFNLAEVMVTEAEVMVGASPGWAVRLGNDREATLAAAILDGFAAAAGEWATEIDALCSEVERRIQSEKEAVRREVAPTEVRFEELD
jgi:alpha-D-ribose 1-methylphosphonate 5-triphosphate synthase subunit PhnG